MDRLQRIARIGLAVLAFLSPAALHAAGHAPPHAGASAKPLPRETPLQIEQRLTPRQRIARWSPFIALASKRFNIPESWVRAVLAAESAGRTLDDAGRPLASSAGALGLMQLMPQTYDAMRAQYGLGPDPQDPQDNIFAGAAYLRQLYSKYGYPRMFEAYNDGPGNLESRLLGAHLMPEATSDYVGTVTAHVQNGGGPKVRFTRPNGAPILVDAGAVVAVRAALPGEYAPSVHSVITIGKLRQGVRESLAATRAILRAHGSPM